MKKYFLSILVVLTFLSGFSQELKSKVYDKKGRLIQRNRLNFHGKLEQDIYGIASMKYEYDKKGNLIRKSYFDRAGKLFSPDTLKKELSMYPSYTLFTYQDEKLVKISQHHTNGSLIDLNGKSALKIFRYNSKGLVAEEITYDRKGKIVGMGGLDIAIQRYTYNNKNQLVEERSFDQNNKLLDFGMNISKNTYDAQGRKKRTDYFFANSSLFHTDLFYYDDAGKMVKEESFNKYAKLEYTLKLFYNGDHLYEKELIYPDRTVTQKKGFELNIPGWKIISAPPIDVNDVDATGTLLITIDPKGNITEVRNSSCSVALAYAIYPYLKELKFMKDDTVAEPNHKGELKVGILNLNSLVEEY